MDFHNRQLVIIAYIVSNIIGLLILWAAVKRPKFARLLFVLLFGWAAWTNYNTSRLHPELYLDYSEKAIGLYRSFINGWFKDHITTMVGWIAAGQLLVAAGMMLKGNWVTLACIGAIIFLLGIAPLGWFAAFPFSLTVSIAAYFIIRRDDKDFLWNFNNHKKVQTEN